MPYCMPHHSRVLRIALWWSKYKVLLLSRSTMSKADVPNEIRSRWRPPEDLTVSQWAEKHRVLVAETSAEPGPWLNARAPYLRSIMDAFSDDFVERIVFCKGSQLGGTEALYNCLGYSIHQDPAPCLFVMPTLELAKFASRARIQPMIEASPELKARKPVNEDDYTTFSMLFPGMVLTLAGANSPASLASRPCRYVFLDEVNKFPEFAGKEADPISLASERQKTFWNRKTVIISTPTTEDGQITKELDSCDQINDYHAPCPHCGAYQKLIFGHIKWPKEIDREADTYAQQVKDSAWYECEACQGHISDIHRPQMLLSGQWLPRKSTSKHPRSVGFHLSSLYSSWLTWGDVAEQFVKSQKYPEKLMNFVNSWLAEPWVQRIDVKTESEILQARTDLAPQTVPSEAVALTCFVDVQIRNFWFAIRAWAKDMTSWLIHYGSLADWADVEMLLFDTAYPLADESGRTMQIWRAAIDTGGTGREEGSMTEEAYWWLRRNGIGRGCRVWGTKGSSTPLSSRIHLGKPLDKTPSGKPIPGGLQIVMLDTSKLKDLFHYRLQAAREREPGGAYLHADVDEVYVRHITAEEKRRDRKGNETWEKVGRRNDLLDCEVGCLALVDPEWPGGGINLLPGPVVTRKKEESIGNPAHRRRTNNEWIRPASNWLR